MPAVLAGGGDGRVLGVWDGYATTDLVDKIRNC
jgi:hypothetical protein